jgi:hypothetical protein
LQDRFRQCWRVTAGGPFDDFKKEFGGLMARRETALASGLTAPERFFQKAQKKIDAGHYDFGVDGNTENKGADSVAAGGAATGGQGND